MTSPSSSLWSSSSSASHSEEEDSHYGKDALGIVTTPSPNPLSPPVSTYSDVWLSLLTLIGDPTALSIVSKSIKQLRRPKFDPLYHALHAVLNDEQLMALLLPYLDFNQNSSRPSEAENSRSIDRADIRQMLREYGLLQLFDCTCVLKGMFRHTIEGRRNFSSYLEGFVRKHPPMELNPAFVELFAQLLVVFFETFEARGRTSINSDADYVYAIEQSSVFKLFKEMYYFLFSSNNNIQLFEIIYGTDISSNDPGFQASFEELMAYLNEN